MKADLGIKCETCGSMSGLTASHYVKKNSFEQKNANAIYGGADVYNVSKLTTAIGGRKT